MSFEETPPTPAETGGRPDIKDLDRLVANFRSIVSLRESLQTFVDSSEALVQAKQNILTPRDGYHFVIERNPSARDDASKPVYIGDYIPANNGSMFGNMAGPIAHPAAGDCPFFADRIEATHVTILAINDTSGKCREYLSAVDSFEELPLSPGPTTRAES